MLFTLPLPLLATQLSLSGHHSLENRDVKGKIRPFIHTYLRKSKCPNHPLIMAHNPHGVPYFLFWSHVSPSLNSKNLLFCRLEPMVNYQQIPNMFLPQNISFSLTLLQLCSACGPISGHFFPSPIPSRSSHWDWRRRSSLFLSAARDDCLPTPPPSSFQTRVIHQCDPLPSLTIHTNSLFLTCVSFLEDFSSWTAASPPLLQLF